MLRGERVSIGPLLPGDASALFRWFNDVEAARFDLAYRPTDWNGFKAWSEGLARDTSRVVFAVRRLDAPIIIGFTGLSGINPVHRSADIAVRISPFIVVTVPVLRTWAGSVLRRPAPRAVG